MTNHPDSRAGDPGSELVEEVSPAGEPIRVVTRAEMRRDRLRHRSVYIAVFDLDGRLAVHQRSPDKDLWPSRWDLAAGGVCAVGEPWDQAAQRELAEELGVSGVELTALGADCYDDDDVSVVATMWVTQWAGPLSCHDGEVVATRFVTRPELEVLIETESWCPDSLALVLPRLIWATD